MNLVKWYLDVVTPTGECLIGYAVSWPHRSREAPGRDEPCQCRPASCVQVDEQGVVRERTRLRAVSDFTVDQEGVRWQCPRLSIDGRWRPRATTPAVVEVLFDEPVGRITWSCLAPAAEVDLRCNGRRLVGYGYAERLELHLPLAALPMNELRWGRFIGEQRSLVWIDWRGRSPRAWVYLDGALTAGAVVSDDRIEWPAQSGRVEFADSVTIRDDRVNDRALRGLGLLRRCVPREVRDARESKWLSRGTLFENGVAADHGWTIHEVVRFGVSS